MSACVSVKQECMKLATLALICTCFFVLPGPAQEATLTPKAYEIRKLAAGDTIKLDGQLSEPAWAAAEVATDFLQQVPDEGKPATQKTEVRLLYDDKNLYIGFHCWQTDKIVVTDLHRDFSVLDNDIVEIVFDAFQDHRNGFSFMTNPMGALTDVQFSSDGLEGNLNWNAVWDVRTSIETGYWTAELVIPFKSLRFTRAEIQAWGVNMMRRARYINEGSCWSFVPRRFKLGMVSLAGTMTGLSNVKPGRNLKVKPFILGSATREPARPGDPDYYTGKIGLDVKYGVTTGLTLDFTANTDFSQVEADVQQINITRFNLFYPEKREFFLENSNLFHLGEQADHGNSEVMLFYSRRIGLDDEGNQIPLLGGARLSGHAGRYELGFLNMQAKEYGETPANNFTVARVRRSIGKNSDIGAMYVGREATSEDNNYNRVLGADANLRFTQDLVLNAFLAKSQTPGISGKDWAGGAFLHYLTRNVELAAKYREVQPDFNAEVGFVRRKDIRLFSGGGALMFHPEDLWSIREIKPLFRMDEYLTTENELDTRWIMTGFSTEFHSGSMISVIAEHNREVLKEDFVPFPGRPVPAGDYAYTILRLQYTHNTSALISPFAEYEQGGYYDGHRRMWGGGLLIHPNAKLSFKASIERNDVDISSGTYGMNLMLFRVNYSFTTRMFLDALVQYNSVTGYVSSNIRFNLIHRPLSDLFIVYNDNHDYRNGGLVNRVFSVKFTRMFDF